MIFHDFPMAGGPVRRTHPFANHDIFLAGYLWKLCAGVDLTPANLSKIQQLDSRGI